MNSILSILVFLPVAGIAAVALVPGSNKRAIRLVTLLFTLLLFAASLPLGFGFRGDGGMEYEETFDHVINSFVIK